MRSSLDAVAKTAGREGVDPSSVRAPDGPRNESAADPEAPLLRAQHTIGNQATCELLRAESRGRQPGVPVASPDRLRVPRVRAISPPPARLDGGVVNRAVEAPAFPVGTDIFHGLTVAPGARILQRKTLLTALPWRATSGKTYDNIRAAVARYNAATDPGDNRDLLLQQKKELTGAIGLVKAYLAKHSSKPTGNTPQVAAVKEPLENELNAVEATLGRLTRSGEGPVSAPAPSPSREVAPREASSPPSSSSSRAPGPPASARPEEPAGFAPRGVEEAMALQMSERAFLKAVVDTGARSADPIFANSCEWLIAGKVKLYAVTRVGSNYPRAPGVGNLNVMPNYLARGPGDVYGEPLHEYFMPSDDAIQEAAWALRPVEFPVDPNVISVDEKFLKNPGFAEAGIMVFPEPSTRDKAQFIKLIKHEVQHTADKHDSTDIEKYKTEYRAYTYQEGPGERAKALEPRSERTVGDHTLLLNAHQERIVLELYGAVKLYPYVQANWNTPSFRDAVSAYQDPDSEGFNRFNSVRVDNLYLALEATEVGATVIPPRVLSAIAALRADERKYVASDSALWKANLDRHFAGAARRGVQLRLLSPTGVAPARPGVSGAP
jgi:hypothetical protein